VSSYILSVDADLDLDDVWDYIAADNIDAADHWIEKLFHAVNRSIFDVCGRWEKRLNPMRAVVEYPFQIASHLKSMDQPPQRSEGKRVVDDVHNGSAALNF